MHSFNFSYRLFALTMAVLMFWISIGFTMDMHYCQNHLVSFSFIGKADSCHEVPMGNEAYKACCKLNQKQVKHLHKCDMIGKNDCCHNRTIFFCFNDDQNTPATQIIVSGQLQQYFTVSVPHLYIDDLSNKYDSTHFIHYQPPIISRDAQVLFESYLL